MYWLPNSLSNWLKNYLTAQLTEEIIAYNLIN
jgi:hypothetical protein